MAISVRLVLLTVQKTELILTLEPIRSVWRHVFDPDHTLVAFYTWQDVTLAISHTKQAYHARLFHAYTGWLSWEFTLPREPGNLWEAQGFPHVDAAFLEGTSDVVVLLGNTVVRLHSTSGRSVWVSAPLKSSHDHLIRLTVAGRGADRVLHAISLSAAPGKKQGSVGVYTFSLSGELIASQPQIKGTPVPGGPRDLAVVHTGADAALVWLSKDSSLRITYLASNVESAPTPPTVDSVYCLDSNARFMRLYEVGPAGRRGMFAVQRSDARGEVFRLNAKGVTGTHKNWEMEEQANDAIYSSSVDRSGAAYVHRLYFGRSQSQLNVHTLWSEPFQGQGQITGYSFGWDHDAHGAVIAAPAEVAPRGQYQLTVRFAAVTSSGSLRIVQEDKLMWTREEGLTEPAAQAIVDIPPFTPPTALHVLAHETLPQRLARHAQLATQLPAYLRSWFKRMAAPDVVAPLSGDSSAVAERQLPVEELSSLRGENPQTTAPRSLNESQLIEVGVRGKADPFGFNKVLVTATKRGKVYAQLTSSRGKFLWEKSLTGFGQGEGEAEPQLKIRGIFPLAPSATQTEADAEAAGASIHPATTVAIVADVHASPEEPILTRVWHLDALTGRFVPPPDIQVSDQDSSSAGFPLAVGPAADAFVLPPDARALVDPTWWKHESKPAHTLAVLDSDLPAPQVHVFPPTKTSRAELKASADGPGMYFLLPYNGTELRGFTLVSANGATEETWSIPLPEGEKVHAILPPDLALHTVANQGKVKLDRGSLYKLLNPHAYLILTHSTVAPGRGARALVVDAVSGRILNALHLPDALVSDITPLLGSWTENWGTVVYYASPPPADAVTASELVPDVHPRVASFELYDDVDGSDIRLVWETSGTNRSSFLPSLARDGVEDSSAEAPEEPLHVSASGVLSSQQTFPLPWTSAPLAVGVTSTHFGISNKALVLTTRVGRVLTIPRSWVDPRRPIVPQTADAKTKGTPNEDGLLPYDGVTPLPVPPQWMVSHIHQVQRATALAFGQARLESYALVWAAGLDTFVTRVAPSGTFDLLSAAFNKPQLLLTIAALSLGVAAAKRPVRNKILSLRW